MWGVSVLRVKAKPHNKTKDLLQKIKEVMGSLDRDTVAKTFKRYRSRVEAAVIATAILLNKFILNVFICIFFITKIR